MTAQFFYNTVYVSGFPAQTSRSTLLRVFGGQKGYIEDLEFTNTPGEPKKAFITYRDASSIPRALRVNGHRIYDRWEALDVRRVDEQVLREHVPHVANALEGLQQTLCYVLDEGDSQESMHRLELHRLTQRLAESSEEVDGLKRGFALKVAEKEQKLTAQLADVHVQLEARQTHILEAQAECSTLRTSLSDAEERLKTAQRLVRSHENEMRDLRRLLQETGDQKRSTIERLGVANNKVLALEADIRAIKDKYLGAHSDLARTQVSLDEADIRLRAAETRAENADKKRKRAEEWLAEEREAKRRLVSDSQEMDDRYRRTAQQVESGYMEKLEGLRTGLRIQVARRKEAEEQLAQANSRLDKSIVTDALLAAFITMENWTVRVLGDEPEDSPSADH